MRERERSIQRGTEREKNEIKKFHAELVNYYVNLGKKTNLMEPNMCLCMCEIICTGTDESAEKMCTSQ